MLCPCRLAGVRSVDPEKDHHRHRGHGLTEGRRRLVVGDSERQLRSAVRGERRRDVDIDLRVRTATAGQSRLRADWWARRLLDPFKLAQFGKPVAAIGVRVTATLCPAVIRGSTKPSRSVSTPPALEATTPTVAIRSLGSVLQVQREATRGRPLRDRVGTST